MKEGRGVAEKVTLIINEELNKLRAALLKKGLLADKISILHEGSVIETANYGKDWMPILANSIKQPDTLKFFTRNSSIDKDKAEYFLDGLGESWGYETIPAFVAKIKAEVQRINLTKAPLGNFTPENLRKLAGFFKKQITNLPNADQIYYFTDFGLEKNDEYFIGDAAERERAGKIKEKDLTEIQKKVTPARPQMFLCSENLPDMSTTTTASTAWQAGNSRASLVNYLNNLSDNIEVGEEFLNTNTELIEKMWVLKGLMNAIDFNIKLGDLNTASDFSRKINKIEEHKQLFKDQYAIGVNEDWEKAVHIGKNGHIFKEVVNARGKNAARDGAGQVAVTLDGKKAVVYWILSKDNLNLVPYPDKETLKEEYKEFGLNIEKYLSPNFFTDKHFYVHIGSADDLANKGIAQTYKTWHGVKFPVLGTNAGTDCGLNLTVIESLLLLPDFAEKMNIPEFREALFAKIFEPTILAKHQAASVNSADETALPLKIEKTVKNGYTIANTFMREMKALSREILLLSKETHGSGYYAWDNSFSETYPIDLKIEGNLFPVTIEIVFSISESRDANKKNRTQENISATLICNSLSKRRLHLNRNDIGDALNLGGNLKFTSRADELPVNAQECIDSVLRALKAVRDKKMEIKEAAENMLKENFPVEMFEMSLSR